MDNRLLSAERLQLQHGDHVVFYAEGTMGFSRNNTPIYINDADKLLVLPEGARGHCKTEICMLISALTGFALKHVRHDDRLEVYMLVGMN